MQRLVILLSQISCGQAEFQVTISKTFRVSGRNLLFHYGSKCKLFQQLKNAILVEVLEAVVGWVLGRYMGLRSDPRPLRFMEKKRAPY